jgi:hypothetical protein
MRLSGLDSTVLLISFAIALVLYVSRRSRRIPAPPGQGLFDMLGAWTTFELLLITLSTLNSDLLAGAGISIPEPAEIIKSNGPLLPIALLYSAFLVARSTFLSSIDVVRSEDKDVAK